MKHRWMILDAAPCEKGNVVTLYGRDTNEVNALVFRDAEAARAEYGDRPRFLDHHATCAQATLWRA